MATPNRTSTRVASLILLGCVAACSSKSDKSAAPIAVAQHSRASDAAVADVAPKPAVADLQHPNFPTTITSDGIGPFGRKIENVEAIRTAMPGMEVRSENVQSEGREIDHVTVSHVDTPVLTMVIDRTRMSNNVFRLTAIDSSFATRSGIRPGSTVRELLSRHPSTKCTSQRSPDDEQSNIVLPQELGCNPDIPVSTCAYRRLFCQTKDLPGITFELNYQKWKGTGAVPAARLSDDKIVAIRWQATR